VIGVAKQEVHAVAIWKICARSVTPAAAVKYSVSSHNMKLWLHQQPRSFPTAKTRVVGEETLSQQENSAVGKEIFANSPKSKN
jgi:hypothetical protein